MDNDDFTIKHEDFTMKHGGFDHSTDVGETPSANGGFDCPLVNVYIANWKIIIWNK